MKVCFKCKIEKPISSFYAHKEMADGHLNKCKDCTKADENKLRQEKLKDPYWREKEKERNRLKYHRLNYKGKDYPEKSKKAKIMAKYIEKYPEKYKAKLAIGKIKRQKGIHMHHWSYNKEHFTDVINLKIDDHYKAHRFIIYDSERMMYRRCDTNTLLDSRDAHINFLKEINIYTF